MSQIFFVLLVCLLAMFARPAPAVAQQKSPLQARDLFYAAESGPASQSALRPLGLRYSLERRLPNAEWQEVAPHSIFHSGDHIRITVTPNAPGYLYMINRGSSGAWKPLYPDPSEPGPLAPLEAGKTVSLPEGGSFMFNEQPGTEALFLLFSRKPLNDLTKPAADTTISALRDTHSRDLVIEALNEPQAEALHDHGVYIVNKQIQPDQDLVVVDLKLEHR